MPTDFGRLAAAAAFTLVLAGCAGGTGPLSLQQDDNWGEANRQTMAAQIIDPAPRYDTPVPATSGDEVARALENYRTGNVEQPDSGGTTSGSISIGSASSGSSSGSSGR